jgi:hypothetical protein
MMTTDKFIHELITENHLYNREHAGAWLRVLRSVNAPDKDEMIRIFLERYKETQARKLVTNTVTQASWRTKCSRRPQRNNHYDSWGIREKYARCTWDDRQYTESNPLTKAWLDLRLQQIRRESSVTRLEFMQAHGFRIRPRDKQVHI